eukprot:CAMPEP_0170450746 /NCGR_PEP_ID=MMETSP0123-20130129/181_1 /TAXON_ID=182087 /ORGANISM="Favella ehrenbergii, Strain Fehren 1" /LENGTH=67 /DNA_ID=CAMNT_0010712133 /DNA_START=114 /DNA_END=317 /DNA_ORIENTATION=-
MINEHTSGCHHSKKDRNIEQTQSRIIPTVIVTKSDLQTVKSVLVTMAKALMPRVMPAVISAEVKTAV